MSAPLLATKLFVPPSGKSLVVRPRLLEKLDGCLHPSCRLMLISAPAGFGKTTLISNWAAHLKSPELRTTPFLAWLSLDEGDNDPIVFWSYVISALQTQQESPGKQALNLLQTTRPPDLDGSLATLINDLARIPNPFILILDDYHHIRNQAIQSSLSFFIEHVPLQFHLIISSRTKPSLPLALLRGRGVLQEIRVEDLRFSLVETADFLNQTMNLGLTSDDIEALSQRTEGWIVGLQMAALSMQDEKNRHAFVTAFSADNHYLADYLIEEVLQRQPLEYQEFLLQTSILDHLSARLCDAVTGRQGSQAILNELERANLFILPLDDHRDWFRYHHLFSELLRKRLVQTEGEPAVRTRQRRAVDWLSDNGFPKQAAEYALKCADYERAANLISSCGPQLLKDGEFNTLLILANHLPDELITQNIRLTCMLAHSANATGHTQKAEQFIRNMEKHLGVTIDEFIQKGDKLDLDPLAKAGLIELGVINARTCVDTFHLERTFFLTEKLLPYLTKARDGEPFALNQPSNLRGSLLFTLGLAQELHGFVAQAAQTFVESANEGKLTHNLHIEMLSLGHLGDAQALEGRLHEAQKTFQETLAVPSQILQKTPFFGISKAGLGTLSYEWNEVEKAEEYFRAAIEHGLWWRNWEILLPSYTGLARIHASRGDWDAAFADLDDLLNNTQEKEGIVQTRVGAMRALLNLRKGEIDLAEAWAVDYEPERSCDYMVEWEVDALVGCRVWIARSQLERAGKLLERIISEAGAAGRNGHVLEALCLRSILLASMRHYPDAIAVLATSLEMAESENYIRTFVDEGVKMENLLAVAVQKGIYPEYATRLLKAFPGAQQANLPVREGQENILIGKASAVNHLQPAQHGLIQPLSVREKEVIALIAEGYSNKEIAQKLHVSVRTVKYYTSGIYTKLEVVGRTQAAIKARDLGLLK